MDSIAKLLQDPGWWFSSLICAIVLAILIAPAQKWVTDWFYNYAGKTSKKWAERKKMQIARRERIVSVLAENPTLLAIRGILNACRLIYVPAIIAVCSVCFLIVAKYESMLPNWVSMFIGGITAASTLLIFSIVYNTTKAFFLMVDAYKQYATRCFKQYDRNKKAAAEFSTTPSN